MNQIDIVIPCYNYARFLNRCVDSVLNQQGVEVRVLIIDDCSTDDTQQVAAGIVARDSRVTYRRHETNKRHIATYNEGLLGWATAEFSLLLSADDMLAPGALLRATTLMNENPGIVMTYGMAEVITDTEGPPARADKPPESRVLTGTQFLEHAFDQTYCLISTPTAVVRTEVQQRLGGYNPALPHSGDVEMWMRFGFSGSIGVLRNVQAFYRWHGANMGSAYYGQRIGDQREFEQACESALARNGAGHPNAAAWRAHIRKKLAEESFWEASRAFERGATQECAEWLAFAREMMPAIETTDPWRKLQVKRRVGARLWRLVSPVLDAIRGVRAEPKPGNTAQPFRAGDLVGWWPG